jgi:ribonuclease E
MVLETNRDLVLRRLVECLSRDRTKHQVAEVTSLGLVQMTRKKLGLGLLESFSENCEVCAGRGLIVHHDPVFRHRAQQVEGGNGNGNGGGSGSSRGRRGRGGGGSAGSAPKNGHGSNGTHAITEDVRAALAQIAKSTVPHAADGAAPVTGVVQDDRDSKVEEAAEAAAEAAAEILDIPVAKASRSQRRISTQDAEQILGSVLEALPEPSQPGASRTRRSRRAGSSGAVVSTGDDAAIE